MVIGAPRHGASQHSRSPIRRPRTTPADLAFWARFFGFAAISLLLRARSPMWLQSNSIFDYGLFGQLAGSRRPSMAWSLRRPEPGQGPQLLDVHLRELSGPHPDHDRRAAVLSVGCGGDGDGVGSAWSQPMAWRRHVRGFAVNPVHLGAIGSLLIREVFDTSVSILLIGSVLLLVSLVPELARTRYGWGYALLVTGGGFTGLVAAAYYLCREERSWIAPAVLISMAAGMWSWRRRILTRSPHLGWPARRHSDSWAYVLRVRELRGPAQQAGIRRGGYLRHR